MAFQYSPKVVTKNMMIYLDSYNKKSYDLSNIWKSLRLSSVTGTIFGENTLTINGLKFNGINTYVSLNTSSNYTIDDNLTFTIGFNLSSFNECGLFISGDSDGSLGFDITSTGIRFGCSPGIGNLSFVSFDCDLNTNYVVTGVHDGTNKEIKLYVDGNLIGTNNISSFGSYSNLDFKMGSDNSLSGNSSSYMSGNISFLIIYNNVLDDIQIKRNYEAKKTKFLDITYPDWKINNIDGNVFFDVYKNDIKEFDTNESILFGDISGGVKFRGGVLAPNGKVYCIPANFTQVMTIDTNNDNIAFFGSLIGNDKWSGGALTPNGKIYCAPNNETKILVIDTNNDTTYFIGTFNTTTFKWNDAILAPNGKIYFIPGAASTILVVDPSNDSITEIGNLGTAGGKWNGGVLAPNGKIYGIPGASVNILVIDTIDNTITTTGNFIGTSKWSGGSLAPNGKIYCSPRDSQRVLEIDPGTDSGQLVGSTYIGQVKWFGSTVAPNGRVYFSPVNRTSVLEIDPSTGITTEISVGLSGSGLTLGCVLSPSGQIYFIPLNLTQVLKLGGVVSQNLNKVLSRYINTY